MNPLDAHQKLLAILPVRTHLMGNDDPRKHATYRDRLTNAEFEEKRRKLKRQVKELRGAGYSVREIVKKLRISKPTVYAYSKAE